VWQNAEFLRIVEQLNNEGGVLPAESGSIDNTEWSGHDIPLFPLAESEFDNYWSSLDPFESVTDPDERRQMTEPKDLQAAVRRQQSLLSPPLSAQQQSATYSPGTKRPHDSSSSPMLLESCGEEAQQSSGDTYQTLSFDVENQRTTPGMLFEDDSVRSAHQSPSSDAGVAISSPSSVDIPLGLLSSLPPNCSVYITHRPASTVGEKSPPPLTQIIINHALPPSSTLSPPSNTIHHRPPCCMPSLMPLPSLPLSPRVPPPSTAVNQFHPLDDARLREPAPTVPLSRNKALPSTVVRSSQSLSTYAATELRHLEVGVDDITRWKFETARRASDSSTATSASALLTDGSSRLGITNADRCRHHSTPFLRTSKVTSPVTGVASSLMPASVVRPSSNKFQRPTSLSLSPSSTAPTVFRHRCRELSSGVTHSDSALLQSGWQRGSVEYAEQSKKTPTPSTWPGPRTPADEADDSLYGRVSHSGLEDLTADSSSSANSEAEGASCLLSNALHRFCASCSSSPSSLVDGADNHSDLPSPMLATATATAMVASSKPCQRTIDALSKKIQRNRTRKSEKLMTVVLKETSASSFTRPDSSCPTPPQSRQTTSSLSSSSASLSPSEASEVSAVLGYSKSCQREVLMKNEYADASNSSSIGDIFITNDGDSSTSGKDPMLPSKRKRLARRKSQTYRQLSANAAVKVTVTLSSHFSIVYTLQKYEMGIFIELTVICFSHGVSGTHSTL